MGFFWCDGKGQGRAGRAGQYVSKKRRARNQKISMPVWRRGGSQRQHQHDRNNEEANLSAQQRKRSLMMIMMMLTMTRWLSMANPASHVRVPSTMLSTCLARRPYVVGETSSGQLPAPAGPHPQAKTSQKVRLRGVAMPDEPKPDEPKPNLTQTSPDTISSINTFHDVSTVVRHNVVATHQSQK